jgi:uncharacterized protein YlzI (FlbEa/FlbD family)
METTNWELTNHERFVIYPLVVQILSHRGKEKVFSNSKIRKILSEFGEEISDMQIRKIAFNIRQSGDITLLLANNEGYFVASNIEEVNTWIKTHKGKIESMKATLYHIENQFENNLDRLKNGDDCGLVGQVSIFDLI